VIPSGPWGVSDVTSKWGRGSLQFDDKSNKPLGALLQFHDERVRPIGVSVMVAEHMEAHERSTRCLQFVPHQSAPFVSRMAPLLFSLLFS
jgi:hypothetical protein